MANLINPAKSWYTLGWVGLTLLLLILSGWRQTGAATAQQSPAGPQVFTSSGTINFQGQLTDLGGSPLNGSYNLRFAIYDASSGGSKNWPSSAYEQHSSVTVTNGLFSVQLGSISTAITPTVFNGGGDRYLQVWVCTTAGAGCSTFDDLGRLPISGGAYAQTLALPAYLEASYGGDLLFINNTSTSGRGVFGWASATSGFTYGVYGQSASTSGVGLSGRSTSASGSATGVYGRSDSTGGYGVYGYASAASGITYGVYGQSDSTDGRGLLAEATAPNGQTYGVYGVSLSTDGRGVFGMVTATSGTTYGVYGQSHSTTGYAGYFSGYGADALYVINEASGRAIQAYATNDTAIWGQTASGLAGVDGRSGSTTGRGVYGRATSTTGTNYGVYGRTDSSTGYAGYFIGNLHTTGNFTAGGTKSFIIDHPLDPANQYLYHYSLEGPQPFNLYRGTVTLDASGSAWVPLPAYFEAINTDFSYLLTPIGAAMPNLHIAQKIQGNAFQIAGGEAGLEVAWLVTSVRNDPWLRDQGFQTEIAKPAEEIGTYLYPQGYGQPTELGRDYLEQTE